MDQATRDKLLDFATTVAQLPNESAKTHQFAGLLEQLFVGSRISIEMARGIEKVVRIETGTSSRRGRIDAIHGSTIIEFERSLHATLADAAEQLCDYSAAVWKTKAGASRRLLCVATDCIQWRIYRPVLRETAGDVLTGDDVVLEELRLLTLTEKSLDDFWLFLTALLFTPGQRQPTPDAFIFDFGALSVAYSDARHQLANAWQAARDQPESQLKFNAWKRYLAFAYGSLETQDELEELFVKHTFLASLARLLVWAALSQGRTNKPLRAVAEDVLSGDYFRSLRIENLVEDDFFQWILDADTSDGLVPLWERLLVQLLTYDLSAIDNDLLKGVYQELVDPSDRHDLGEYYTPDWLCVAVVRALVPAEGFPRILDPSCGSGSFLRAAIAHILSANPDATPDARLGGILAGVAGIDIHPLAVTISRATYVLALGELVKAAAHPIQIPVFLADALFLPVEVKQFALGTEPSYQIDFGGRSVALPEELVRSPELFDQSIAACTHIAEDHAASGADNTTTLQRYLERRVPELAARADFQACVASLWSFTANLAELIATRQDTIWSFIVRNAYRPAMLRHSFDYIVGNPPWLSYNAIKDARYQAEIKRRAVEEYAIAPRSQRLMTHMELATIFLAHALHIFGDDDAQLGFVMPRSVLSADQHANLRAKTYLALVELDGYWDLVDVEPLFRVPSCVIFATRRVPGRPTFSYTLQVREFSGRLPRRNASFDEASMSLKTKTRTGRLIYLGRRTALSTGPGKTRPQSQSVYAGRFKQGATIVPRNFYFVSARDFTGAIEPQRTYWLQTDEEQAKTAKKPYKSVKLEGDVEGEFLYYVPLAKHALPFLLLAPPLTVLPIDRAGRTMSVAALRNGGWRGMAAWLEAAEERFQALQKATRHMTTLQRLDYQHGLESQQFSRGFLVLYAAAGKNVSACVVDLARVERRFKVDHTLYWCHCETREEADFLAAILNSQGVNEAIKPFQSRGLLGERHVHKKVLEVSIPQFAPTKHDHMAIAALGNRAAGLADALSPTISALSSLARQRALLRRELAGVLREIDEQVIELLSD